MIVNGEIIQASDKMLLNKTLKVEKDKLIISAAFAFFTGNKVEIPRKNIKQAKEISSESSSSKSVGGTLEGAAIGGLLTGGIGALVGGLAFGNNKGFDVKIAFELHNGEWFTVHYASNKSTEYHGQRLLKQIKIIWQYYLSSPFA